MDMNDEIHGAHGWLDACIPHHDANGRPMNYRYNRSATRELLPWLAGLAGRLGGMHVGKLCQEAGSRWSWETAETVNSNCHTANPH